MLEALAGRVYRAPADDTGADERTTASIAGIGPRRADGARPFR